MTRNMGSTDRLVRALLIAPAAIVAALLVGPAEVAGVVLLVVAGVMLATSIAGFCPLYALLGISTDHRPGKLGSA